MVLFKGCAVSDEFAIHVDKKVVPVRIHIDEWGALDVELKQGLQVIVSLSKQRIVCVDLVNP